MSRPRKKSIEFSRVRLAAFSFAAWFFSRICGLVFFKNCLLRQPSGSPQRFQPKGHDMFILREVAGRVVMQRAPDCRDYWRLSAASTYGISAP
jgi:hypothetical protein